MASAPVRDEKRWVARPVLSRLLRIVLLCTPLVTASAAVRGLAAVLPASAGTVTRLVVLGTVGFAVALGVERLARRFLPLAALLRLTMLFPDRAPSRFRVARAAGDPQALGRRLAASGDLPAQRAAEQVLALITALGTHDRRTRGHCERVRVFTDLLAEELRLDQDARDRLRWTALLHDVGKLSIAAQVLNKPAALDARELAQMQHHPQWGAEFAAPLLPWLGEWGSGIAEHHERYDGTGYPQGLAATAISPAGRIVGLIDAYETMTASRTYKKAMTTRAAREELAECAGSHFDPGYVRAFLAVSLPRVLWAMGPLALAVQLPYLRSIAEAGARAGAVTGQATALAGSGAVAAAGVTGVLMVAPTAAVADDAQAGSASASSPAFLTSARTGQPAGLASGPSSIVALAGPAPVEPAVQPETVRADAPEAAEQPRAADAAVVTYGAETPADARAADPGPAPGAAPAHDTRREEQPSTSTRPPGGPVSDSPALVDRAPAAPDGGAHPPLPSNDEMVDVPLIEAGPHGRIRERTAVFVLRAPGGTDQLECALDDGPWTPCSGEVRMDDLADGRHVLAVRVLGTTQVHKRTVVVHLDDASPAGRQSLAGGKH